MENINEDFKTVCKQLNIEVELKKLNKGSNKKYIYSEETKSIIKSTYKRILFFFILSCSFSK